MLLQCLEDEALEAGVIELQREGQKFWGLQNGAFWISIAREHFLRQKNQNGPLNPPTITGATMRSGTATRGGNPSSRADRRWQAEPDVRPTRGLGLP